MLQAIQQNPLISLIVILVPCVAIIWKLLEVLYVKPRDFRIATLEKRVEELRNEQLRMSTMPQPKKDEPEEQRESKLQLPQSVPTDGDPLASLTECYKQWTDQEKTDLQRKRFEETYSGKAIVWKAYVDTIDKSDYNIRLSATDEPPPAILRARMFVKFPLTDEDKLMKFKSGDYVRIKGTIREFFLNPIVDASEIEAV